MRTHVAMQFGIRSALAITAAYAVLFAVMRPFGAVGMAAAVFSGTAFGALIVFAKATIPRRERTWLLLIAAAPPVLLWLSDRQIAVWDGRTNLLVEFVVSDADTGKPIPIARIEVQQAEGSFYDDRDPREFMLVANSDGVARRECPGAWSSGHLSRWGSVDTFYAYLPRWRYRALADGFEPGEWVDMEELVYRRQAPRAQRAGPGKSRVVVPVLLRKRQAKAGKARPASVRS